MASTLVYLLLVGCLPVQQISYKSGDFYS